MDSGSDLFGAQRYRLFSQQLSAKQLVAEISYGNWWGDHALFQHSSAKNGAFEKCGEEFRHSKFIFESPILPVWILQKSNSRGIKKPI